MSQTQLEINGGQPQKQPKYVPIFMDKSFTGIWTQRSVLHDPSDVITQRYYGGRPDAVWRGSNVELTNNLTLKRRPGLVPFVNSPATVGYNYPLPPDRAFSFQLTNGTIQVLVDTGDSGELAITSVTEPVGPFTLTAAEGPYVNGATDLTSVATSSNGVAVYTGTVEQTPHTLPGYFFEVSGFTNSSNNGIFYCIDNTSTTITLANPSAVAESASATATSQITTYTGTITGGGGNAYIGMVFTITGFDNPVNNGTFLCSGSSSTQLLLVNAVGSSTTDSHAGTATCQSAVYTGTITNGNSTFNQPFGAYAGYIFEVNGFVTNPSANNGTFLCTFSDGVTLILTNPLAVSETNPATAETWGAVYWDQQNGSAELLFAKSPGAGQSYFVESGGILYVGDGVDTRKYTPLNPNSPYCVPGSSGVSAYDSYLTDPLYPLEGTPGQGTSVWNWGITPPSVQPNVVIVESGDTSVQWQPDTVWSTMGLIYDSVSKQAFQLIGVNANPNDPNTTQFGESGTGQPVWPAIGGDVTDNTITWFNYGPVVLWKAGQTWNNASNGGTTANPCIIYDDQITHACYINIAAPVQSTTNHNASYPKFVAGVGQITADPNNGIGPSWLYIGIPGQWEPDTTYSALGNDKDYGNTLTEPVSLDNGLPDNETVYWIIADPGGTSASSGYTPNWGSVGEGQTINDNQLLWLCLGGYTWTKDTAYYGWYENGAAFSVVKDGNGNFQVALASGTSGGTEPTWGTEYGSQVEDGANGLVWTCVGQTMVWAANTTWYLPASGFVPPATANTFGSASIIDSNNNVEFVIQSGLGKTTAPHPTWNTNPNGSQNSSDSNYSGTTDNDATWYNAGAPLSESLQWQKGYAYGFSYKSLAFDDYYASLPLGGGNIPPGITAITSGNLNNISWTGVPKGSATNTVSSCSPAYVMTTNSNAGAVNTITGPYSPDPQCDTIILWRSADGGGSGSMYELTEIPNNPSLALPAGQPWIPGTSPGWSFRDFLPDTATTDYPGLNTLIPAPVDEVNNPPYSTYLPQAYNFERVWGSDGQYVEFSGGPDTLVGNPDECFNPSDNIAFLAPVIKLVKTSQGLVTFLTDSIEIIAGGPATSSFFEVTCVPGVGLLSFNAADLYGGEIYFFASDNQFRVFTPSLSVVNGGFPLGDQFANLPNSGISDTTWNPSDVYVTVHQNGIDNCIMVADGSTGWYRQNPHQAGGIQGQDIVWSPYANIVNGCQMVQSVEITPGIKKLLVGPTGPGQILARDLSVYLDNGYSYDAYFEMGNIQLAKPGQLAVLKFFEFDFSQQNYLPTVSYLLDEVSGDFIPFVNNANLYQGPIVPVPDPPLLYGATTDAKSYSPNRYYFKANASVACCRHLRLKIDFGGGSNLISTTITSIEIVSNVLTIGVTSTTGFEVGSVVTLSGLTNATFLNGAKVTLTAVGANTLTADYTYPNYELVNDVTGIYDETGDQTAFSFATTTPATTQETLIFAPSFVPTGTTPTTTQIGSLSDYYAFPISSSLSVSGTMTSTSGPAAAYATFPTVAGGPTFVQGKSSSIGTGTQITFASDITAGNAIVAVIQQLSTVQLDAVSISDNQGNTYETIVEFLGPGVPGNEHGIQILCAFGAVGGSTTITVGTVNPDDASARIDIMEVNGFEAIAKPDTGTATTGVTGEGNPDELLTATIFGRVMVET